MTRHSSLRVCGVETCRGGDPRLVLDGAVICPPCTTRMAHAIAALPDVHRDLADALAPTGRSSGSRVSGTPGRPLPIRLTVAEHRADITAWLHAETTMWAAELPVGAPPAGVDESAAWLAGLVHLARHYEWAPCTHDAARALLSRARALCDAPRDRARFPVGGCPQLCTGRVWAHVPTDPDAAATLACDACNRVWPAVEWNRLGRRMGRPLTGSVTGGRALLAALSSGDLTRPGYARANATGD